MNKHRDNLDLVGIELIRDAEAFMAGMNRSRLGDFASDEHLVLWMSISVRNLNFRTPHATLDMVASVELQGSTLTEQMKARKEVFFWWSQFGDIKARTHVKNLSAREKREVKKLELVYNFPEYHDYFHVGLWDIDLIARCVADEVDPELALSLVVA